MEGRILNCPNCDCGIMINEIRCGILRCGIYKLKTKNKWRQMPKHGKEETIKKIINNNEYLGCGSPLKYNKKLNILEITDWNT